MNAQRQDTMTPVDIITVGPRNGHPVVQPPVLGGPEYTDYYLLNDLLTDEQQALRRRVRDFMDREVIPIINPYWERAEFPHELVPKLAQLGITGFQILGYGCPGMSNVTAGIVILELARGDLSISTFSGVHSALAMMSIALLGSEEQKQRFLPPMARLEKIGAFGLTEPAHGRTWSSWRRPRTRTAGRTCSTATSGGSATRRSRTT
ncbi:acyl-CoA dehydrogenase family protein [Streptomyces sp. YGL11-2]|uniref:acyl-CoA dehydrogenase family protein n=1 Tax=Streptomyces sp. YGL11-2 TaxID=3414028 RepID=UPI003CE79107